MTLVALLLLLTGLTTVVKAGHVIVWKISILGTEYGHWLALATLVLLGIRFSMKPANRILSSLQIIFFIAAIVLFIHPVVSAELHAKRWAMDLEKTFNIPPTSPLLSFSKLWRLKSESGPAPEKHIYLKDSNDEKALYFYRPESQQPAPWVLMIHGGGWDSGDSSQLPELNYHLAHQGIAVIAMDYRLAPQWKWPAQRDDVVAAVAYVKNHAKDFNIDPAAWAIMGRSAGGHIAEAYGYQIEDPTLKGVIAYYSPSDLDLAYRATTDHDIINSRDLLINLLGGTPDQIPEAYRDASPLNFAEGNSPPTLLIHGRKDSLTWYRHSRRLRDKIAGMKGRVVHIEFPWATHAFDFNLNGPAGQISTRAVDTFLYAVLENQKVKGDRS